MRKTALIILDGWGKGAPNEKNAVYMAQPPYMTSLLQNSPNAELLTHGQHVGLPDGQMGNSEVGHLNIGAGRIVYQDLVRINNAIQSNEMRENPQLNELFQKAKKTGRLHLMGLVSDGGVHSHIDHLKALIEYAVEAGIENVYVHAFTDGRDCDPNSGISFIKDISAVCKNSGARLASIIGRYYAMDRDKRWERIKMAYDLLVGGKGKLFDDPVLAIKKSYDKGITDEFLEPQFCGDDRAKIHEGDAVLCFNFRTDRCREITVALTQEPFENFEMAPLKLDYYTMTEYDKRFKNIGVLYSKDNLEKTLGEVIADNGLSQLRIAETEKYPHVTFFFSGGREQPFEGEKRILVNSPKVATYDLQPEMSAPEVTEKVIEVIQNESADFICLNFANPDMVGHTGVFEAVKKAVLTVDTCLKQIVEAGQSHDYSFVIIADHGNADKVINQDGSPNTAHTTNPVPIVVLDPNVEQVENGILADVAPTILRIMGVKPSDHITGKALV